MTTVPSPQSVRSSAARSVLFFLAFGLPLAAQGDPHWGIQGDYYAGTVPSQIVDHLKDLVEKPDIDAKAFNTGLVRFHADGSPNWSVEFSKTQLSISGSRDVIYDPAGGVVPTITTVPGNVVVLRSGDFVFPFPLVSADVRGGGTIRGAMVTKYLNFFSRTHVSAGFALGGGVGQLEATYTHSIRSSSGTSIFSAPNHYSYTVPTFQALAQVDVRPVRWISLSPFYGIRNGTFGFGGAVRIHFTR